MKLEGNCLQRDTRIQRVLDAIYENNLNLVKEIVYFEKIDIKDPQLRCYSLLCSAINLGHINIANWLLSYDCPINDDDEFFTPWSSALHAAVYYKRNNVIGYLLEKGANVTLKNPNGETAFYTACYVGNLEAIKLLLNKNTSLLDEPDDSMHTPLHVAVEKENLDAVQLLLNFGANVKLRTAKTDQEGFTPLHVAVVSGNLQITRALLLHRWDSNDTVQPVQDIHGKVVYKNNEYDGFTLLHMAVKINSIDMINLLVDYNADVNATILQTGITPLHLAVQSKNKKIVMLFSEFNANFLARTSKGKTILHLAIENNWCELVKVLLLKNANVNDQTLNGETPIHIAVKLSYQNIVSLLLNNNANVRLKNLKKQTPLHYAIVSKNVEITKLLLKKNADINDVNDKNENALTLAVKSQITEMVSLVLNYKPSINKVNLNAFFYAIWKFENLKEIIHLFLDHGFQLLNNIMYLRQFIINQNVPCSDVELIEKILPSFSLKDYFIKSRESIHLCILNNEIQIIELLIRHGYKIDETNCDYQEIVYAVVDTNLDEMFSLLLSCGAEFKSNLVKVAAKFSDMKIIRIMLNHGLEVGTTDEWDTTVLHFAIWHEQIELINYLICEKKAPVNTMRTMEQQIFSNEDEKALYSKIAMSPLHLAVIKKRCDVVQLLLDKNADVNCKDGQNETALHYATKNASDLDIIKLLLRYGADINILNDRKKLPVYYLFDQTCICNDVFRLNYDLEDYCECYVADDFEQSSLKELVELYLKHIIYFSCVNKYVHPDNIKVLSKFKNFENLHVSFLTEVTNMKNIKILDNVTFYDLLIKKRNLLSAYGRNQELMQAFEASDYENKFPIYAKLLEDQKNKAQRRAFLLEKGELILNKLINLNLPELILDNIFNHLSTKDLETFNLV